MQPQNIIVGLSGGVDSSVTAALLHQQGHNVRGIFMQNWEDDNTDQYCSIKEDSLDAMVQRRNQIQMLFGTRYRARCGSHRHRALRPQRSA